MLSEIDKTYLPLEIYNEFTKNDNKVNYSPLK